jgi:hypothetical protein
MPTPKNAAAAPPVAPNPIPASHSRGDLADSPCHCNSPVVAMEPANRVLSHMRTARIQSAKRATIASV